jgi:hypothetical protein
MVPSYQLYTIGVPQLQTRQQGDGFNAEQASVDVVTLLEVSVGQIYYINQFYQGTDNLCVAHSPQCGKFR